MEKMPIILSLFCLCFLDSLQKLVDIDEDFWNTSSSSTIADDKT